MNWLTGSWALIGELTLTHLTIAVPAIIASVLIAVPIGAWAQRSKGVGGVVLSFLTVLYAVPSLPLLIVIPVLSGVALRSRVNMPTSSSPPMRWECRVSADSARLSFLWLFP